jgi:hypothetical protein
MGPFTPRNEWPGLPEYQQPEAGTPAPPAPRSKYAPKNDGVVRRGWTPGQKRENHPHEPSQWAPEPSDLWGED